MQLIGWKELPEEMRKADVFAYYQVLSRRRFSLAIKRIVDIIMASLLILLFIPFYIIIAMWIKIDSRGPVFFRQLRVTQYGHIFRIYKFRTMVKDAESLGTQVTTKNDLRITRIGKILRKYRIDETPQLFNVWLGEMTFVGTRPELKIYVEKYTDEMLSSLLLPAGITSEASIAYKDEERLLANAENADDVYTRIIIPDKMTYNLNYLRHFGIDSDFKIMVKTLLAVFRK